jgi:SAM-dependent methyltransferase
MIVSLLGGFMKPVALISVCILLLFGTSVAHAQFRGSAGGASSGVTSMAPAAAGARSSTAPMASGVTSRQTVQPSQSFRGFSAQPPIQAQPGFQSRSFSAPSPIQPIPGAESRGFSSPSATIQMHRGRGGFVSPPVFRSSPRFFILGRVPFHSHRHWFFHRHPGVIFIDSPFTWGPTVITQVAPGVVQAERRYFDGSPGDTRLRVPGQLAPFDPTPQEVVERMLALAAVKKSDVIYDLGSGDGRILITAAKRYGARGVGFEIDPGLVKLARENARKEGVEKLVEIRQQDFLTADLSPASVVTLYLSYEGNLVVRPQLMRQLKPGARVVSYAFDMGEWQPKIAESYRDAGGDSHQLYLWDIGEPMVFSDNPPQISQQQPTREGPLIIDVP